MLVATFGFCVVGWVVVLVIPDRYQATTRIYVDTSTLLAPLLKGMAVDTNVAQQVDVMQRTLMSRPNMESVLRMTDLDLRANSAQDKDDLIRSIESRVAIRAEGKNLFTINYVDSNRTLALKTVQSLVTIFVEKSLGASRLDIQKARKFIDDQIVQYETRLKLIEGRMAAFKQENPGLISLGGSVSARLDQAISRAGQTKAELEDAMAQRDLMARQSKEVAPMLTVDAGGPDASESEPARPRAVTEIGRQVSEARQRLSTLRTRFTPQHPDVVEAQNVLNTLVEQQRGEAVESAAVAPRRPVAAGRRIANPVFDQLRLRLLDAEGQVQTLQRRLAGQQVELARLEELAKVSPALEAQSLGLDWDYQVIRKSYEELLERRESAKLSQDIDLKADKVEFRIVDPPRVPPEASFPNRPLMLSAVLVAGLGGGMMWAFLRGRIANAFSTVRQLRETTRMNVLGAVSIVTAAVRTRRSIGGAFGFTSAVAVLLAGYATLMAFTMLPMQTYLPWIDAYVGRLKEPLGNLLQSLHRVI